MKNRFCKKCLLDKVMSEAEYNHMQDYIKNIDINLRTSDKEYKKRLDTCMNCDDLINGMCKICGCFVEMRAAVKKNYCPNVNKKWYRID